MAAAMKELTAFPSEQVAQLKVLCKGAACPELSKAVGAPVARGVLLEGAHGDAMLVARGLAGAFGLSVRMITLGMDEAEIDGETVCVIVISNLCGAAECELLQRCIEKTPRGAPFIIGTCEEGVESKVPLLFASDRMVCVPLGRPDESGRTRALKHRTKRMKLAGDVTISELVAKTDGLSAAQLVAFCEQAAMRCMRDHVDDEVTPELLAGVAVSMKHFSTE